MLFNLLNAQEIAKSALFRGDKLLIQGCQPNCLFAYSLSYCLIEVDFAQFTENILMYVKTKSLDTITVDNVYDFDLVIFFF